MRNAAFGLKDAGVTVNRFLESVRNAVVITAACIFAAGAAYSCAQMMTTDIYCVEQTASSQKVTLTATSTTGANPAVVAEVNQYLSMIPENVSRTLKPIITVSVTTENLARKYPEVGARSMAGLTSNYFYSNGAKYSLVEIENRHSAASRSSVHEVGHVLDFYCGNISLSAEFARIYNAEKNSFVDSTAIGDGHERSNVQEYFASAFSEYVLNPGSLVKHAPQTFGFIGSVIDIYCK